MYFGLHGYKKAVWIPAFAGMTVVGWSLNGYVMAGLTVQASSIAPIFLSAHATLDCDHAKLQLINFPYLMLLQFFNRFMKLLFFFVLIIEIFAVLAAKHNQIRSHRAKERLASLLFDDFKYPA